MSSLKVLYVASEITPFLSTTTVAKLVNKLVFAMQEKGIEIRILVPRFGVIQERKNRLHEVVRLSGVSIPVGNEERILSVKVASIPGSRCQVYFIDNVDYFHRKAIYLDEKNNFFEDNDERVIFFCKGVLETVKNLDWAPDVVHCHDWITSLIPLYLKTAYQHDPTFQQAKVLYTVYNNRFPTKLTENFAEKAKLRGIQDESLRPLAAGFRELIQAGAQYADTAVKSEKLDKACFKGLLQEDLPYVANDEQGIATYLELYQQLAQKTQ